VRVLVATNIYPTADAPARAAFVRDQVEALREEGLELELFTFEPGRRNYRQAIRRLRELIGEGSFDLVHAHYGLVGSDVRHRLVGRLSRRLARRVDLVAAASKALFAPEAGRPGLPYQQGLSAVLPCGVALNRFAPRPRAEARARLGLDPNGPYLLFPADPGRAVKRVDRARELAAACGAELLEGGSIPAEEMPDWVNAANAVAVTSDNEGFGLTAIEALACDVPVFSTPVGIAPLALDGVAGCLVGEFDLPAWTAALQPHTRAADPRIAGRSRAEVFSARRMAARVTEAYRDLLD
jgi:glycosyltransferase involved in cell wall biosynthesis